VLDHPIRAVGLISGGLDSALAARLLLDQGIEVIGLHLESPTACRSDVREVARHLGIRLEVRPKGEAYLRLLRDPRWGYGRNMNPCMDCRHFMLGMAQPFLAEFDARFLFTGEVVGQRPMSQQSDRMMLIEREAGLAGRVLRPLSARLLPETEAERLGWVDRSRLLAISGRGRHDQLALAERYGLAHYQSPGGGCLLTDPIYSRKLRDLFDHPPAAGLTLVDVELLAIGRHLQMGAHTIVIGRDRTENERLRRFEGPGRRLVEPEGFCGPSALVCGADDPAGLEHARACIARHARTATPESRIRWHESGILRSGPLGEAAFAAAAPNPIRMLDHAPELRAIDSQEDVVDASLPQL
jgi:tRNA-uridine 2-sulfurtransferase